MFDAVSYEDYQAALEKAKVNYTDILNDNNISQNMEDNLITLNAMIPFFADQDILDELYQILEEQLESNEY